MPQDYATNRAKVLARTAQYYEDNKERYREWNRSYRQRHKTRIKQRSAEWVKANPDKVRLNSVRKRARSLGLPFDLELEDVRAPSACPILGIPIVRAVGRLSPNSPSVDRIDPAKGYVKGNTQIISQRANVMKNDASREELLAFADWIRRTYA